MGTSGNAEKATSAKKRLQVCSLPAPLTPRLCSETKTAPSRSRVVHGQGPLRRLHWLVGRLLRGAAHQEIGGVALQFLMRHQDTVSTFAMLVDRRQMQSQDIELCNQKQYNTI